MMTASTSSARSSRMPHLVPSSTDDIRSQLPGAILEINEDIESHGPMIIKQELEGGGRGYGQGLSSSENVSRTSVFSDHLPCGLTRFHFSLFFGMVGFVVFWLGLLLKIYLRDYLPIWMQSKHGTKHLHPMTICTLWGMS